MRKMLFAAVLSLALGLSGCATMYQSLGLATLEDIEARDKKIASLEEKIAGLMSQVQEAKTIAQKAEAAEALARALEGRMDQLPQETLKRLAAILVKAAEETPPQP